MNNYFLFFLLWRFVKAKKTFINIMKCWYDINLRLAAQFSIKACNCSRPWLFTFGCVCFLYRFQLNESLHAICPPFPLEFDFFVPPSGNRPQVLSCIAIILRLGSLHKYLAGMHDLAKCLPRYAYWCPYKWEGGTSSVGTPCWSSAQILEEEEKNY